MVSVIIPMYNASSTIERCLRSVMEQSFSDLEIIVVDDGSKDNSAQIVDSLAQKEKRIHCCRKENGGVSSARNHGLDVAKGEYICFVDSDDAIEKNCIASLLEHITATGSEIAICGYCEIDCETETSVVVPDEALQHLEGSIRTDLFPLKKYISAPWGKLYSAKIIRAHDLRFRVDMVTAEDQYFNYHYFAWCSHICFVNRPYYRYYVNESGLSKKRTLQCMENEIENMNYAIRFMKEHEVERGMEIIAASECYAVRRYIFLTDGENTIRECCSRLARMNLLNSRMHLPRWQDNIIYQLMLRRLYFAVYVYWRLRSALLR